MFDNKDFFVKRVKITRSVYQGSGMSAVHLVLGIKKGAYLYSIRKS